jgi:gluconokinase
MGVSGSGKSTVGQLLRDRTGWDFYDADHFHPPENIAKMSRGIPLTDLDREPWLIQLQELIDRTLASQKNAILACSALKNSYRDILQNNHRDIVWIYLKGDYQTIVTRIQQRTGHFLPAELLLDQFNNLEEPKNAIIIDVSLPPSVIVDRIIELLLHFNYQISRSVSRN